MVRLGVGLGFSSRYTNLSAYQLTDKHIDDIFCVVFFFALVGVERHIYYSAFLFENH